MLYRLRRASWPSTSARVCRPSCTQSQPRGDRRTRFARLSFADVACTTPRRINSAIIFDAACCVTFTRFATSVRAGPRDGVRLLDPAGTPRARSRTPASQSRLDENHFRSSTRSNLSELLTLGRDTLAQQRASCYKHALLIWPSVPLLSFTLGTSPRGSPKNA